MSDGRTTLERAALGYDSQFECAIADAVTEAIANVSRCTDANVIALRVNEIVAALVTVLAGTLALSPAVRSPTALRKHVDVLAKQIRMKAAAAVADPAVADFKQRSFDGLRTRGRG